MMDTPNLPAPQDALQEAKPRGRPRGDRTLVGFGAAAGPLASEELRQIARLALAKAIRRYRESDVPSFALWDVSAFIRGLRRHLRQLDR